MEFMLLLRRMQKHAEAKQNDPRHQIEPLGPLKALKLSSAYIS